MPSPIDTAIVLAASPSGTERGIDPLTQFAGLSLVLRTVLTLQKEGVTRVIVDTGGNDERVLRRITTDARVHIRVETGDISRVAALSLPAASVVASHDVVLDPIVYRLLRAEVLGRRAAVIATSAGEAIGPFVASPEFLRPIGTSGNVAAYVQRAALDDPSLALDVGSAWHERVVSPKARRRAENELFEACRKPMDGIVARRLNRHVSIFISKCIVNTPLTPNMLSAGTFVLAIAAAVFASRGGYMNTLIGAFLFQWNSILDGVDGELARVRFQHSKLGQWIDTVSDDASNAIFYAGLLVGAAPLPCGSILVVAGWIAIGANVLASAQYYTEMVRLGTGDLYAIDWDFDKAPATTFGGKLLVFFRNVLKKDFAILFFLALALVGILPYALPIVAGGQMGTLIAGTLRNLKKRSR